MSASSPKLYIGLMTGTSADGIDAALIDCCVEPPGLIATYFHPYPTEIKSKIVDTINATSVNLDDFFLLDRYIAQELATASCNLLCKAHHTSDDVIAIGSHGQTIRHRPNPPYCFTVQLGDPNIITARTGIDVVADFRRADMAIGGQGAPLAPLFHDSVLRQQGKNNVVVNLGGIANITVLADNQKTIGFDTGPANSLMDLWIKKIKGMSHDNNGEWAASGSVDSVLLNQMLKDPYFSMQAPKSTGREYFGIDWLENVLSFSNTENHNIQTTLCELTATTIARAINQYCTQIDQIFLCGGGQKNNALVTRIKNHFLQTSIWSTSKLGLDPDFLEAIIFGWLAHRHITKLPGNMPSVTGSNHTTICGCQYRANTCTGYSLT